MNPLKISALILLTLIISIKANAQDTISIVDKLVNAGFENVRVIQDSLGTKVALENNARYPHWKAAQIVSKECDNIIFTKRGVPYVQLLKKDSVWTGDYYYKNTLDKEFLKLKAVNPSDWKIDLMLYPELIFSNVMMDRIYEAAFNLNPTVRLYIPNNWSLSAQFIIPVYNNRGDKYSRIRPNMLSLNKQVRVFNRLFLSMSAGLFTEERYGVDVKAVAPITKNWSADLQLGVTGYFSGAGERWQMSAPERLTAIAGIKYYESRTNLQFHLRAGRYVYGSYGAQFDVIRHFNKVSICFYAMYASDVHVNGGFRFAIALPPYKQKRKRRVNFAPGENFRVDNMVKALSTSTILYRTTPEESELDGSFNPDFMLWGINKRDKDEK